MKSPKSFIKTVVAVALAGMCLLPLGGGSGQVDAMTTYYFGLNIAAGENHIVAIERDDSQENWDQISGNAIAIGDNSYNQLDVAGWDDIEVIAAGANHTVGVREDGTVVATGDNTYGQLNVERWIHCSYIAAGTNHTVAYSGTHLVAVGDNSYGQLAVAQWQNVATFAAGANFTVASLDDGSVVATGDNGYGQLDVEGWQDVIYVTAGANHTVGLKADGTVVATGANSNGQLDVGGWTQITAIVAGKNHTVGLKSDGTVVAAGANNMGQTDVANLSDIEMIYAGGDHTIAVSRSQTSSDMAEIMVLGSDSYGESGAKDWNRVVLIAVEGDYLNAQDKLELEQHNATQEIMAKMAPMIYILIGALAAIMTNLIFDTHVKKGYMLIDCVAGTIGAVIFGVFGTFAMDDYNFTTFAIAFVGAVIGAAIAGITRRSVLKNRVATSSENGNAGENKLANKGFVMAVIAWVINSMTVGIIVTIRVYDLVNQSYQGSLILELLRICATNLAYEAVFWTPLAFVAGGIYRKKGLGATIRFIIIAFVACLVLWGSLMWVITG